MTGACQPSCASRATSASTATTPPSSPIRLARASTCGTPTPRCSRGGLRSAPPVAVNGFFCTLARAARDRADRALVAWWSERRCAARWGRLVRPDGYGRWRDADAEIDFFVEVDRATEPAWRLADKLDGYATLAAVTGVATPVLFWFPSPQREATARAALATPGAAAPMPVATASSGSGHLDDPAGPIWQPLGSTGARRPLAVLAGHPGHPPPAPPPSATPQPEPDPDDPSPPPSPPA
jgi:hypothetical protein